MERAAHRARPAHDWLKIQALASHPVPFRGGGFAPRRIRFAGLATAALALAFWHFAGAQGLVSPVFLPPPLDVANALMRLAASGELTGHAVASLRRFFLGFALGGGLGIAAGLGIGLFSLARSAGIPVISALFPIPKIALLPLFILWFGIGEGSKVATIAFGTFFPMAIAAYGGVDGVDRTLIRMGQSFGLSPARIVKSIVLPGALPAMLSGARIASSIGIVLLVAAEMIGAREGLGALVLTAGNLMATETLLAGVVLLSILGLCIAFVIGQLERRLLAWR